MPKQDTESVNLLDLLASVAHLIKRNFWLAIVLPLAGLIAGLAYAFVAPTVYESKMLIETSLLSANESTFLFNDLKRRHSKSPAGENVRRFDFEILRGAGENKGDFTDVNIEIEVKIVAGDTAIFEPFQQWMVNTLNNSSALMQNRLERQRFYEQVIAKIDREIAGLDQLKQDVTAIDKAKFLNPSELYTQSVELFRNRTHYQIKLDDTRNGVHLVEGLYGFTEIRPSPVISAALGLFAGIVLLMFWLVVMSFRKYFRQYESQRQ
jgi:hypothetical protein